SGNLWMFWRTRNNSRPCLKVVGYVVMIAEIDPNRVETTMIETSGEGYHLSPQQRRLWTLQQLGFVYNTCCLVRIDGSLQTDRLQAALAQTVQRHEILRTLYRKPSGVRMPLQMVAASLQPEWHEVDLTALEAFRQEAELAQLFACEKRH